jgi:hypothetical protein
MVIKQACWDSIHMLSIVKDKSVYTISLESTVILSIDFNLKGTEMNISSNFKKTRCAKMPDEKITPYSLVASIGSMVEENETQIRYTVESFQLSKVNYVLT